MSTESNTPQSIQAIIDAGKAQIVAMLQDPDALALAQLMQAERIAEEMADWRIQDFYDLALDGMKPVKEYTAVDISCDLLDTWVSDEEAKEAVKFAITELTNRITPQPKEG